MTNRNPFKLGAETETDPHSEVEALGRPSPAPSPTQPRRRISRYQLIRPLGTGGMGVVFQGRDLELHRDVAIKLVRAVGKDPAGAQARLRREAQTMAALSHPNLVAVHDIGDLGDRVFIAMELLRGGTLRDLVGAHHDWREQLRILIAAGRGLAAAHAAGVIHRDFKPDNVLLGESDRVVVADFGLARSFDPLPDEAAPLSAETCSMLGGTLAYMPPERIAGETGDPRVDQFAWCVTAFEVLEGHRPFNVSRPGSAALRLALHAERLSWSRRDVPLHIRSAIDRGLSLDRNARWPSIEALLTALAAPRARRRSRRLGATGLLVLAAALAALSFRGSPWRSPPQDRVLPESLTDTPVPTTGPWAPTLLARESGNLPAHFSAIDDSAATLAFASRDAVWTQQRYSGARNKLTVPDGLVIEAIRFGRGSSLLVTGRVDASWSTYAIDTRDDTVSHIVTLPTAHVVDVSRDGRYLIASTRDPAEPVRRDERANEHEQPPIGPTLVPLQGGPPRLTHQLVERNLGQCVWSPSGDSLACIEATRDESQVVLLDVATGRSQTLARVPGPHTLSLLRWPEPDQLLVVELQTPATRGNVSIVQHWTMDQGELHRRRVLYVTQAYDIIVNVEIAKGELLYTTMNQRRRTGIIPMVGAPAMRQLQLLDTGSLSDGTLIGWFPSGEVALNAITDGYYRAIRMTPGGRPAIVGGFLAGQWPAAIVDGNLVASGVQYRAPACAADSSEPCLVMTRSDGHNSTFQRWKPEQGATGPELFSLPLSASFSRPSLSRSGKLAVIEEDRLGIYDLSGRRIAEFFSVHQYDATAWSAQNRLYALRSLGAQNELVRLDEHGAATSIFRHPTFSFHQLKISADEARALVSYLDTAVEHWNVNLQIPSGPASR